VYRGSAATVPRLSRSLGGEFFPTSSSSPFLIYYILHGPKTHFEEWSSVGRHRTYWHQRQEIREISPHRARFRRVR